MRCHSFILNFHCEVIKVYLLLYFILGFLGGSDGQESACSAGDPGSIPGSERLIKSLLRYNSHIIQSIHLKYTIPLQIIFALWGFFFSLKVPPYLDVILVTVLID